jgi:hypothetical protein
MYIAVVIVHLIPSFKAGRKYLDIFIDGRVNLGQDKEWTRGSSMLSKRELFTLNIMGNLLSKYSTTMIIFFVVGAHWPLLQSFN